jgi:hypothetical protein
MSAHGSAVASHEGEDVDLTEVDAVDLVAVVGLLGEIGAVIDGGEVSLAGVGEDDSGMDTGAEIIVMNPIEAGDIGFFEDFFGFADFPEGHFAHHLEGFD